MILLSWWFKSKGKDCSRISYLLWCSATCSSVQHPQYSCSLCLMHSLCCICSWNFLSCTPVKRNKTRLPHVHNVFQCGLKQFILCKQRNSSCKHVYRNSTHILPTHAMTVLRTVKNARIRTLKSVWTCGMSEDADTLFCHQCWHTTKSVDHRCWGVPRELILALTGAWKEEKLILDASCSTGCVHFRV